MTTSERKEKLETINSYLSGMEMVLTELNDVRFPSANVLTAISHIRKAQIELQKEISKLKTDKT